jgi:uncharacterized protein (DUF697 family)
MGTSGVKPKKDDSTAAEQVATGTTKAVVDGERHKRASQLVDRFAVWAGVAGFIPVPLVDVAAVGGLQFQMVRRLSELYGVPFSTNLGKSLIASLAGSTIPAASGIGVASALKAVPLVGTAISTLTMPGLSAGAAYAIGRAFIEHFESGGTLLDFRAPDYREFIKAQKEVFSLRSAKPAAGAEAGSAQSSEPGEKATTSS